MTTEPMEGGPYETSRRELAARTPDELAELIFERFEDTYPSDGLYAGTLRDRAWQFVLNRVQAICGQASDLGTQVWDALQDEHTAHNVERFALVCGFFASKVFPGGHWHAHEVARVRVADRLHPSEVGTPVVRVPAEPDEPVAGGPWAEYPADAPLRAGTAQVLPDLLYVEYFCSRAELVGRGNAGRLLHEALVRNSDAAAPSGQIFADVPQWAKEFSGLEAHERDHVRRLLSTSFGLLCHSLRAQQLTAARDLVIEAARRPDGLRLPLNLTPSTGPAGPAIPADRAAIAGRLRAALEHHISLADFRVAEPALAGWTAKGCNYVSGDLPGDPSRSTLPIANAGLAKHLTANHLLELFGCCEQGNRLLGTGCGLDNVVSLLQNGERRYTLPLLIWFSQFPTPPGRERPGGPHTRPGELYLGYYRTFPLELFAAADLALWPPFAPDGFVSDMGEVDWTDISPAYRFAKILLAYKSLGVTPGEWPTGPLNVVVPDLQRRVCELHGWPTPGDLAARWHDHLTAGANTWFADPAVGGFRHATSLRLLALRRDRPGDVVINNVEYNAAGVSRSAGWITREPGSGLTRHTLAAEADRQGTELWFGAYALLPALLGASEQRLDFLRACTPEVRLACIEAFDTLGRVSADWPSDEFRQRASELLHLAAAAGQRVSGFAEWS